MNTYLPTWCSILFLFQTLPVLADGAGAASPQGTKGARDLHAKEDETRSWMEAYFKANGIAATAVLRVEMKLEDFVKILGEPTKQYHFRPRRVDEAKPKGQFEDWVEWYHNPQGKHVAPVIRVRIENGVVKELVADRV